MLLGEPNFATSAGILSSTRWFIYQFFRAKSARDCARLVGISDLQFRQRLKGDVDRRPASPASGCGGIERKKAPPKRGLVETIAARLALVLLTWILLAGLLLPALLSALAGLLGLLTRVALLPALLAALVRIALVLLSALILVCHFRFSLPFLWLKGFQRTPRGEAVAGSAK